MLAIARNKAGEIQAVQATYLDKISANKVDKTIPIQKQTFGVLQGAPVTIPGHKEAPTIIAEGTETGLSLAAAIKNATVKITLGKANFKHIDPKTVSEKVVFALDNDGKDIQLDRLIEASTKRLIDHHKQVAFMLPTSLKRMKQDYNDILKQHGHDAIKKDFENAIPHTEIYGSISSDLIKKHIQNTNQTASLEKIIHDMSIKNEIDPEKSHTNVKNDHRLAQKNNESPRLPANHSHSHTLTKTISNYKEIEHEI